MSSIPPLLIFSPTPAPPPQFPCPPVSLRRRLTLRDQQRSSPASAASPTPTPAPPRTWARSSAACWRTCRPSSTTRPRRPGRRRPSTASAAATSSRTSTRSGARPPSPTASSGRSRPACRGRGRARRSSVDWISTRWPCHIGSKGVGGVKPGELLCFRKVTNIWVVIGKLRICRAT